MVVGRMVQRSLASTKDTKNFQWALVPIEFQRLLADGEAVNQALGDAETFTEQHKFGITNVGQIHF